MSPSSVLLVIEDDPAVRRSLAIALGGDGYQLLAAANGAEALSHAGAAVDLILLDLQLPDADGLTLLPRLKEAFPEAVVVVMTAHATVDRAVEAMQRGAFHFVQKPFELDHLRVVADRALETTRLRRELRALRANRSAPYAVDQIIGSSAEISAFKTLLEKTARSPASTVLLLGESGTGKGLAAKTIHHNSARGGHAFMNITCSAVPATLLESELFGHERGAFTDAKQQKKGLLELADGGTVFLDEFTEMDPMLQAKLLRFLEERTFKRVGGFRDISVDVRVIAATNRDMAEAVKTGSLRKDLYYRLQVLTIWLPPLRERIEDIPPLAEHFIEHFNREFGKQVAGLTASAVAWLQAHPWDGNVRELRNTIERAMLFAEKDLLAPEDLLVTGGSHPITDAFQLPADGIDLERLERNLVEQALQRAGGNRTRAGALLGISRDQVRYRIEKYKLE